MSDVTVKARYRANSYNIYLDYGEGVQKESIRVEFDSVIDSLPDKDRDQYTMIGWELDGVEIEFPYFFNYPNDITLKAIWVDVWEEGLFSEVNDFFVKLDNWFTDYNNFRETIRVEGHIDTTYFKHDDIKVICFHDIRNKYLQVGSHSVLRIVGEKTYVDRIFTETHSPTMVRRIYSDDYYFDLYPFNIFEPNYSQNVTEEMKFKKIKDNHYKIEVLFSQPFYDKQRVLLEILGLSNNDAKNKKYFLEFNLDETKNELTVTMEFADKITNYYEETDMDVRLKVTHTYDMMGLTTMIDLTTQEYEYYLPNSFASVEEITDITKPVSTNQTPVPHFYKAYFESGQYVIDCVNNFLRIKIYNLDRTEASEILTNNSILIIEEGYYYIEVLENYLIKGYEIIFEKQDIH